MAETADQGLVRYYYYNVDHFLAVWQDVTTGALARAVATVAVVVIVVIIAMGIIIGAKADPKYGGAFVAVGLVMSFYCFGHLYSSMRMGFLWPWLIPVLGGVAVIGGTKGNPWSIVAAGLLFFVFCFITWWQPGWFYWGFTPSWVIWGERTWYSLSTWWYSLW